MQTSKEKALVAIHCLVYNHEPYIRDCLEGFVMQKTNFNFVAIVHDDASTDKSAEIIREYEAKYPEIIKPIYENENQWSKTDYSLERIINAAINATDAKYIAYCEGDDYWIDPLKLQKQVDFLEGHKDYSMCVSNRRVLLQDGTYYEDIDSWETKTKDDVLKGYIPHTQTIVINYKDQELYRSAYEQVCTDRGDGDRAIAWYATQIGKIYNYPEQLAVYRLGVGVMRAVEDDRLEYYRITSYVEFQHRVNIPDRRLYVVALTDKCWDLFYYSHKRKQSNLYKAANEALVLWLKETTLIEQVIYCVNYFFSKTTKHISVRREQLNDSNRI